MASNTLRRLTSRVLCSLALAFVSGCDSAGDAINARASNSVNTSGAATTTSPWSPDFAQALRFARPLDLAGAQRAAVTEGKAVGVLLIRENCHSCEIMVAETFSQPVVQEYLSQELVMIAPPPSDLNFYVSRYGNHTVPCVLVLDQRGNLVGSARRTAADALMSDLKSLSARAAE